MTVWWWSMVALAQPVPLVALGDGLVPIETADEAQPSSSWVAVLADCLEERAPGAWTVADRTEHGQTAGQALARVPDVRRLVPGLVVVGVGAPEAASAEASPERFRADVDALVAALLEEQAPQRILLVGMVPAGDDAAQLRAQTFERELASAAEAHETVQHLDLWSTWPATPAERAGLASVGGALSARGHARVAAVLCDEVLQGPPRSGEATPDAPDPASNGERAP